MIRNASKTMRIDLIPGISSVPLESAPQPLRLSDPEFKAPPVDAEGGVLGADVRAFFHSVYDAGFITDAHGRVLEINSRAVDFFQAPAEDLLKLSVPDFISGADEELLETVLYNLESERFTLIQAYCVRADQTYFPAEIVVSSLRADPVQLCFFVRDITVRRRAEEMLRTEHAAIQNAAEGIAVTDSAGEIEYVNPAVAVLWGYEKPEDLVGCPFGRLFRDASKGDEMLRRVMQTGDPWRGELEAQRADHRTFFAGVSAVCNRNTDGDVVGAVLLLNDLTDQRRARQVEREAERQRVMLETLAAACHHLGQPATILTSNLELLELKLGRTDPDIQKLIDSSMNACEQLANLLERMRKVHVYQPTRYISDRKDPSSNDTRIIEI